MEKVGVGGRTSESMKFKCLYKVLSWPVVTLVLYGLLRNVLNENWLPKLWAFLDLAEGLWLDISVSLVAVVCLLMGWRSKSNHYSCHHVGILLSILLLMILFYINNESIPFLQFIGLLPCWFVLLGAFVVGIVAHYVFDWIAPFIRKIVEIEELPNVRLFQDKPVKNISEDGLYYNGLAKRIASAIINNTWQESFSIGVTGTWGAGKSSMLLFVKEIIEKHDGFIIIEFNPRQSSSIQDIQKDFLGQLADVLGKYHTGAVRVTQKYMQAIGALPDSFWAARVIGNVSEGVVEKSRDNIVKVINQVGKKIVVFIDDFDRLTGEEIQEVLKLIDKNAAFPKTFFVTAYDKIQANQVISNYMGLSTDGEKVDYTDKYFNIEVSLPKRRQSNYVTVLRESLYALADNKIFKFTRNDIDEALPKLFPYISKCLPSIRDIKRYSNLISLTLPLVEDDVLLGDFLLVDLIRYRYPEEYNNLSNYNYVVREGGKIPESKCLKLNTGKFEKTESADILKVLFDGKKPVYKSVSHVNSFTNYFYDIDSGHLPYRELSDLLNPSITLEEYRTKFKALVKNDNEEKDFVAFVLSFSNNINNEQEATWYFMFFLMARTFCQSNDLKIATTSYLLKDNVQANFKQFGFEDGNAYIGFLKDALNDKYDYRLAIEVLHGALHAVNSLDRGEAPTFVFTADELMDFARKKLQKSIVEISTGETSPEEVFRAYKACVKDFIKDNGESIDSVATEILKEVIKENPDFFFKDVLTHRKASNVKSAIQFFMEGIPYKELFKNTEDFEAFFNGIKKGDDSSMMLCISQFAEMCKAQGTWEPTLTIKGDISSVKLHDYAMYNKLLEGEPVDA